MKREKSLMIISLVVLSLVVIPMSVQAANLNLKVGTIRAENSPTSLSAMRFAELVEEKSDGDIEVKVYPNSQLGGILDMITGMKTGTIDLMYEGLSSYSWVKGAEPFSIISVPFLWRSYEHMEVALESERFQKLFDEAAEESGIRIFEASGEAESRQLTTENRPVRTAEDFKGLKIRIAESAVVRKAMEALEANPTVIPFSELYMSLRQGIAEAQENGFITIKNQSLYEVQNYLMPTHYIRDIKAWYIAEEKWNTFTEEQQQILKEAAIETGEYMTKENEKQVNEAYEFLANEMEVVEPDLESIRKKVIPAFEEEDGSVWPEGLLDYVNEIGEEL